MKAKIKKRIEEETGYKLGFEVDFEKVNSKSFNMINFKIFSEDAKEIVDNTTEWYKMVFLMLKNRTYYNATDNRAQVVADTIRDQGQMRSAYEKLSAWMITSLLDNTKTNLLHWRTS